MFTLRTRFILWLALLIGAQVRYSEDAREQCDPT